MSNEIIVAKIDTTYADTIDTLLESPHLGKDAKFVLSRIKDAGKEDELFAYLASVAATDADSGESWSDLYQYTWEDLDELLHHEAATIGFNIGVDNL